MSLSALEEKRTETKDEDEEEKNEEKETGKKKKWEGGGRDSLGLYNLPSWCGWEVPGYVTYN